MDIVETVDAIRSARGSSWLERGADGGQVNNWGRSHPNGGVHDVSART